MNCPTCKKQIIIKKDEVWIGIYGTRIKILDYSENDIWRLNIETEEKSPISILNFLEFYQKED
ncbi:MAG: hypothetical protein V1901_04345 [Patescibacteria group bacterium]